MQSGQEVVSLHLDDIIPNRFQPREVFDERALKELAASIREHGVIQPIIVRQVNNKYEIIAGERRYKASALAGMTKIPAIINNLDDKEAAKVALLENLQRRNLNPIEEARTYQKILELDQMTQESLAKTMGKSQSAVANKLRLLALSDEVQDSLLREEISERHARTLLNVKNPEEQKKLLDKVIKEKMSVRKLEEEIKKMNEPENVIPSNPNPTVMNNGGEKMNNTNNDFLMNNNAIPGGIPDNFGDFSKTKEQQEANYSPMPSLPSDIVNYGEIDEDEINYGNKVDSSVFNSSTTPASTKPDISQIKNDTFDISSLMNNKPEEQKNSEAQEKVPTLIEKPTSNQNEEKQKISNDLDSLLNIKPAQNSFNPTLNMAEPNVNEDEKQNNNDYFNANDLKNVDLPNISTTSDAFIKSYDEPMQVKEQKTDNLTDLNKNLSFFQSSKPKKQERKEDNNKSLGMALIEETYNIPKKEKAKEYNVHQMVQKIRDLVQELEKSGTKIDTDEIDFENQYQIVIRIDKNS